MHLLDSIFEKENLLWMLSAMILSAAIWVKYYAVAITILIITPILFTKFFFSGGRRLPSFYYFVIFIILNIVTFTFIYKNLGLSGVIDTNGYKDYFYFSIVTWTTLGYGDLTPSADARLYAATQALLGYTYMALLVGKTIYWLSQQKSVPEKNG